jgi:hypothetical protein
LDASTDKAGVEDMIQTRQKKFLYQCATADGYFQAVQQEPEKPGLHWLSSCQPIGNDTDGAASLTGVWSRQLVCIESSSKLKSCDTYTPHCP